MLRMRPGSSLAMLMAFSAGCGGSPIGEFSLNDVRIDLVEAPAELKKLKVEMLVGWKNCPAGADCLQAALTLNGDPIGTVRDLGVVPVPISEAQLALISSKLRPNQDNVLTMSIAGQSSTLTMRCPKKPALLAPTGSLAAGTTVTARWEPFEGVTRETGLLAPSNSFVAIYTWGATVGLALAKNQQVRFDATSADLPVPTRASAPLATRAAIEIGAAGAVVETQQGGDGACYHRVYQMFDWNG